MIHVQENLNPDLWKNLETFGVLCHGKYSQRNIMFQYNKASMKNSEKRFIYIFFWSYEKSIFLGHSVSKGF